MIVFDDVCLHCDYDVGNDGSDVKVLTIQTHLGLLSDRKSMWGRW